jgi:hypothetical protein
MSLLSTWFRNNDRLKKTLISDPFHVKKGDRGDHVTLIHGALLMLDKSTIAQGEQLQQIYGDSTAKAVLEFKKKRKIINFSYQTSADNIVGRMTMRSLDTEMLGKERRRASLLLSFGVTSATPKVAIISQSHPLPATWAKQVADANKPNVVVVPSPVNGTPAEILASIKKAVAAANGGLLILSVGHGIAVAGISKGGGFDIADNAKMRIGGFGSSEDPKTFVNVFYADPPPPGATIKFSEKEIDERTSPAGSERRLKNFATYQDLSKIIADGKLGGVVLLTCNIGKSTDFLKKVASQWKTPIIAYRDFTVYRGGFPGPGQIKRVRAVLSADEFRDKAKDPRTNTPFAEVMFPLSATDMILIRP